MAIKSFITDLTDDSVAPVGTDSGLRVQMNPYPPMDYRNDIVPYTAFMATSAGATSMLVNGSVTNVDFLITANLTQNRDRYIKRLVITIADASASASQFGNLAALTNGCYLFYFDTINGTIDINNSLKTNFDVIRMCNLNPAWGATTNVGIISNVVGNSEAYFQVLDFTQVFGMPHGLRLKAGSSAQLVFRVRDNISTMDGMNIVAYGFERKVIRKSGVNEITS